MKEQTIKKILLINLFISAVVYLPILIPWTQYFAAYSFLFQVVLLHSLILISVLYSISALEIKPKNEASK